jgi:hypothetical protein
MREREGGGTRGNSKYTSSCWLKLSRMPSSISSTRSRCSAKTPATFRAANSDDFSPACPSKQHRRVLSGLPLKLVQMVIVSSWKEVRG